jgi:serine/threonine-protein kinase PRP4
VKRRSKSRESPLEQTPKEDIKVERRSRRSRSTESLRDLKGNGREDSRHARTQTRERSRERSHRNNERAHGRVGSVERRRRSRSNESMRNSKGKDSLERKHGSPSKERVRERVREKEREGDHSVPSKEQVRDRVREKEREGDDGGHDSKRYRSRTDDLPTLSRRSDRHEQEFSGHGGGWPRERSHKEAGDRIRADSISMDRRPRSHSRESVREWEHRDGGSKQRQSADEAYERSSTRYSGRGKESHDRGYNYAHDARNGSHQAGGRDSSYGGADKDRNRDKSYGQDQKHHSRDEIKQNLDKRAREEENEEEYKERIESQLAAQEEDDVERIKEESRRRRQAILEKYKQQQQQKLNAEPLTDMFTGLGAENSSKQQPEGKGQFVAAIGVANPVKQTNDDAVSLDNEHQQNGNAAVQALPKTGLGEGSPKSERSADMFCDDIFGDSPAVGQRMGKGDGMVIDTSGLTDNWDDAEGRYSFRIGEILDGRYEILSSHGSGVFSTVVRARDMKAGRGDPEVVAIKIIRNNETMYRTGQQESVILRRLSGADPNNRRHCVQLFSTFEYRNHLCLVFESLHMNLREILKTFGRNIGIRLTAVQAYAKQLFIALKHLRNCGVLHCDIKPDNMLVNDAKNVLKLCDFGSAMFAGENEITPYLVSRFYRAPEISKHLIQIPCTSFCEYLGHVELPQHGCVLFSLLLHHCCVLCVKGLCSAH